MTAGPIVVGYDGTEGARAALAEALRVAGALGVDIVLAFAYWTTPLGGEVADLLGVLRERGEALTEEAMETARAAGVQGQAELVNDRPATTACVQPGASRNWRMVLCSVTWPLIVHRPPRRTAPRRPWCGARG